MMAMSAAEVLDQNLIDGVRDLTITNQNKDNYTAAEATNPVGCDTKIRNINNYNGVCAICLNKIVLEETALVKACRHAYCVTCILKWASCKKEPTCPQCKNCFEFLNVHRTLDDSIQDYMFEESVCLLLRASWFQPLALVEREKVVGEEIEEYFYEDEEENLDDVYLSSSSSIRIGNRRWGDNGFVRGGRQEARPVYHPNSQGSGAGPSRRAEKKEARETVGRRAKRALKREAADKTAAAKHEQHLARLA